MLQKCEVQNWLQIPSLLFLMTDESLCSHVTHPLSFITPFIRDDFMISARLSRNKNILGFQTKRSNVAENKMLVWQ